VEEGGFLELAYDSEHVKSRARFGIIERGEIGKGVGSDMYKV
jgi:hypothetical protein